ncbi:MAG: ATPase [Planctomycetes bacterium]|nr:ATPase [Planctomycetota bacterium]
MNTDPIVAQQTLNAPVDVVWRAITEPDQMRQWYFDSIADFKAEPGFQTEFNVHFEGVDYLHQWRVTEVEPRCRIVYDFKFAGIEVEYSYVVWELEETPGGTKLTLTNEGNHNLPRDNSVFSREAGQAGWDYFVCQGLPAYLSRQNS